MLLIAFKDQCTTNGVPKILFSRVSPPIHIDSRIAAREKDLGIQKALDLFSPDNLEKKFVKRVKGKNNLSEEIQIENDLKGLFNYLSAPNIKQKIKNLLFLLLKFSNCLKVFFPKKELAGLTVNSNFIQKLNLLKLLISASRNIKGSEIYLLIQSEASLKSFEYIKTVFPAIKAILNDRFKITFEQENIPEGYEELVLDESFFLPYTEIYLKEDNQMDRDEQDSNIEEFCDIEKSLDAIFRVNKETLEKEYNLVTLNLETIKVIDLKEIVKKEKIVITEDDLVYLHEGKQS